MNNDIRREKPFAIYDELHELRPGGKIRLSEKLDTWRYLFVIDLANEEIEVVEQPVSDEGKGTDLF